MSATKRVFRQIQAADEELNRVQKNVENAIAPFLRSELLDGRLIENVSLSTTVTKLEHKLGRAPRGYIVTRLSANANVYDSLSSEQQPTLFLPLTASASCVVSVWVF